MTEEHKTEVKIITDDVLRKFILSLPESRYSIEDKLLVYSVFHEVFLKYEAFFRNEQPTSGNVAEICKTLLTKMQKLEKADKNEIMHLVRGFNAHVGGSYQLNVERIDEFYANFFLE